MSPKINYVVAIPSYNRSEQLPKKTLKVLLDKHVPENKIFIFLANNDELKEYKKTLPNFKNFIVGVKGLKNQRNFITKYFKEGQNIVEMDDDIEEVYEMYEGKEKKQNKLVAMKNLDIFFQDAFEILNEEKLYLWGVYPVDNPYFMSDHLTTDLRFVVGPMWGKINRHDKDLVLTIDEKEDVERTLQHYSKDKGVVRFNDITMKTTYYKTKGGMQAEMKDRKAEALKSAKYLVAKYPKYATLYLKKKSGHPEVKLRDRE